MPIKVLLLHIQRRRNSTLIDKFGRNITYMRMSVTEHCNLRCRYCMPEGGACQQDEDALLTEDEMITAVRAAASLGIKKLRITGGEPLVKKNIISLCSRASTVDGIDELCLTTNATLMPQYATALKNAGVTRVNISLDTLDEQKYAHITRGGKLKDALNGIDAALAVGFDRVKLNAVLIGGFNDDEIEKLAGLTLDYPVDVRFIELMPMEASSVFGEEAYIPDSVVLEKLPQLAPQPPDGGVARLYCLPNGLGNIGLISPLSAHFCADCTRIRLTADGKLKPCLHSPEEYSIKGLDYAAVREQMIATINAKPQWHGVLDAYNQSRANRSMNRIGG